MMNNHFNEMYSSLSDYQICARIQKAYDYMCEIKNNPEYLLEHEEKLDKVINEFEILFSDILYLS
jgi:hypothetical protein